MGSAGLRMINAIVRHVFRQNTTAPCPVHFTSQVIEGDKIKIPEGPAGELVRKSFAQSGNCYLQAKNRIAIGSGTRWGPGVKMISANRVKGTQTLYQDAPSIILGPGCYIGTNAIILPGVQLQENVIVGAGAVVTKSFPAGVTIAGNPAKVIG